ncbi:P-loop containing nucleoside triphosphate hydrolase protein [Pisolithus orientalis]|uniref:P-loop containing nucleoside triphosphate hydrolase protein n=1 Tax=Pisolithus orientalis TaxID=936130 RepID=UPI002225AE02|nr:P-loop containing nucleoside triphosphate hydrolase protein [Pisolithus orientalis]KAI6035316.1 P-loop containing nucleoside triphosphate hydrolase protein [Pisolithus orientalis]
MGRRQHRRDELTADDLLRLEEERPTKRLRSSYHDDNSSENGSFQDFTDSEGRSPSSDEEGSPLSDDRFSRVREFDVSRGEVQQDRQGEVEIPKEFTKSPTQLVSSFAEMGISPSLEAALRRMSIHTPTEIQSACIPPLLSGRDSFAVPIIQRLVADPYGIFALVLTPTRELAFQISEQFAVLGAAIGIRTSVIVGGMDMITQALELDTRPHVVVATPGRIVDHLKSSSGGWDLSRIKYLVLDEADRLLAPTFAPELAYMFQHLPIERQTCLFTATLTPAVEVLAETRPKPGKMKPFFHRAESPVETVANLKQHYLLVPYHVREVYLFHLLCNPPESTIRLRRVPPEPFGMKMAKKTKRSRKHHQEEEKILQPPPTIIFCTKPRTVAYLVNILKTLSIRSTGLHSRLTQRERLASLSLFKSAIVPVLVSTGHVAMIINWDLPREPEEYTHRVGRTARAGKGGVAISFVTEMDEGRLLRIEDRIGTKLTSIAAPEDKVLEKLNTISTAKRLANMELHDSNFGKREEIHKAKSQEKQMDVGGDM